MLCQWQSLRRSHRLCTRLPCNFVRHDCRDSFRASPRIYVPTITRSYTSQWTGVPRQRRKDLTPIVDTIYALSTAPGKAAIAIVRISGPACLDIYGGLCPRRPFPVPRVATLRKLVDPSRNDRVLDPGSLVLYFPAPKTVTGEDLLELHIHGGPAIVRSVLEAIPRCADSRPRRRTAEYSMIRVADPGEFTKRAFYNGVIDLTQAEALGETLAAETERQRRLAVAGSDHGMSARYEDWRQQLLYARGEMEALIDFSEDQHFDETPSNFYQSISTQIQDLQRQMELHIKNASRGELLRNGINVALVGAPNAGKSSLLNQIVGREAAIVSGEPGTTRDIVDVTVDIGGWLVNLGDMAGLRRAGHTHSTTTANGGDPEPSDIGIVEQEGIRRARERALQADLILVLVPLRRSTDDEVEPVIDPEVLDTIRECQASGKKILYVVNKIDLLRAENRDRKQHAILRTLISALPEAERSSIVFVSCKEAALRMATTEDGSGHDPGGLQTFLGNLMTTFTSMTSAATGESVSETTPEDAQAYWNASLTITHRQSGLLRQCLSHLRDFLQLHGAFARVADQSNTPGSRLSHHVDNHVDLVGEVSEEIAHQGLKCECNSLSAAAASADHPPASAYHGLKDNVTSLAVDENGFDVVNAAEHLRYAAECLSKITGRGGGADVEEVLGVVFEK